MTVTSAVAEAHARLVEMLAVARNADGGWSYYPSRKSRLEATCWAALGTSTPIDETPVARWLTRDNVLVEPATGRVNYAFNGLAALSLATGSEWSRGVAARVAHALLDAKGVALPASDFSRQDNSLQGWSWTSGTFTWIEPTAWCLLAIKRLQPRAPGAPLRIEVAERVFRDRECSTGGWNVGTADTFDHNLPAHAPPTALGVLALQDRRADPIVRGASAFLQKHGLAEGSMSVLSLTTLALHAIGRPTDALVERLARLEPASTLSNAAVLGMGAYALGTVGLGRAPAAVLLGGSA